ncbi:RRP12 protein, putative [Ixodes scapularis]|uniref:RRP12 protein, putative n=1 Tax=Ixodes scapularis TaxID=6945 RepID=B7P9N3_IXOSC|nr:RRP12 protein, putative [Ixodes scapularis]|eukprot:XP_002404882.1 RRP12 protein, putative [Ixodes scapularis]
MRLLWACFPRRTASWSPTSAKLRSARSVENNSMGIMMRNLAMKTWKRTKLLLQRPAQKGLRRFCETPVTKKTPTMKSTGGRRRRHSERALGPGLKNKGKMTLLTSLTHRLARKSHQLDPKSAPKRKGKCSFDVTEDGRLLIVDERLKPRKKEESASDVEEDANDLLEALSHYKQNPKRRQSTDLSAGEGTSGTSRAGESAPPKKRKAADAKGASGDRKKGRFEPYAYVPMNRKALNKRFKKSQEFKNIIKAAQKGAKKGQKKAGRAKK